MPVPAGFDPKLAHVAAEWAADGPLVCCRFDTKGRYVFCGLERSVIQRFSLADGKRVDYAGGHDSWVFSLACTPDGAQTISGGGDGRLSFWETDASAAPKPIRQVEAHKGWIRALGVSPDGSLLASGGDDKLVKLWEMATGKLLHTLEGHTGLINSLVFHPGGKLLLTGDLMGVVKPWDLSTPAPTAAPEGYDAKPLHTYEGGQLVHFGGVRGLAISPDAQLVAAGGLHKATNPLGAVHEPIALIFEAGTRKLKQTLLADGIPNGVLWQLRFLADGTLLGGCGGGSGGILLFWKPDTEKAYHRLALPNILRGIDLHPDGLQIASAHYDRKVRITRLAAKAS